MPRGNWDWGVNPEGVTTAPEISSSELAVRLGAINRLDRLGEVILADSFEDGLVHYSITTSGVGSKVILWAGIGRSGAYAIQVTTSSTNNQESGIIASVPLIELSRSGFEISGTLTATASYLVIYLTMYTGSIKYDARLRYRIDTHNLEIWVSPGTWLAVGTATITLFGGSRFTSLKVVGDPITGTYVRAVLNGLRVDISTNLLISSASTVAPSITVQAYLATLSSGQIVTYLDDAIITQNEP